jgi:uncharacterized protein (UPF0261 family)
MRTSPDKCTRIAEFIVSRLRDHVVRPELVRVLLPSGGISILGRHGPFQQVGETIEGSGIEVRRDERAINDSGLAALAAESVVELIQRADAS